MINNKEIVRRFNLEVIEQGNFDSFKELMDDNFINRSSGSTDNGPMSMWNTFVKVLKPAFPDLKVEIYDQIVEQDKVVTRKAIIGTHLSNLFDIEPTGRHITIDIIDIVRLQDGKYIEHWGMNTFSVVIDALRKEVK